MLIVRTAHATPGSIKDVSMSTAADKIPVVEEKPPRLKKDWRFYTGTAALGLSFVMPLCALFVPLLGLPTGLSAVIVGLLVAGGPEVMGLIAVALLGKETFQYFIYKVKSTFRDAVMVRPVSQTRYYFGLALHLGSWLPLYLYGYWPALLPVGTTRIYILAAADFSFIVSMFIMGGEFWEKVRRIFVWEGRS